ncbi:mRNA splicing protein prp28 [Orbilia ellipsospora]|uniref:RNA helicase n=1 Tax=Orbilia ellipsospora TaxID=2528407 RepID=A0AAV9WYD2_9PEZI
MNGHFEPPPPPPPPADDVPPPPPNPDIAPPPPPPNDAAPPPPPPIKKAPVAPKKTPLSVEDLLRKKKAADEAAKKPKFLSKAEREALALERRAKEVEAKRQAEEEARSASSTPAAPPPSRSNGTQSNGVPSGPRNNPPSGPRSHRDRDRDRDRERDRDRDREPPTGPASMRNEKFPMAPPPPPPSKASQADRKREAEEDAEAKVIRLRYMGADLDSNSLNKKKRRKTSERKFTFEWGADEDTSQDYNPIYAQRSEAKFFGRGRLGGFAETDRSTKQYAAALESRGDTEERRRARELVEMDRRKRENMSWSDKHWSEKPLEMMKERDWRIFKEDFNISTKGGGIPNPMRSWKESGLPKVLLDVIRDVGYKDPSPIQRAAIPIALLSRDVIGVAVTGSGKTASFILPLLVYIKDLPPLDNITKHDGPYAIILAPTRELAQQIEVEATKFAEPLNFRCVSIVGGHSIEEQSYSLKDGAEIVIATPGRLLDCLDRRVLVLSQCCYVIMDEADRMIDLGFEEPVNRILDSLPASNEKPEGDDEPEGSMSMSKAETGNKRYRQTMMYTATMPPAIERIARKYLRRPAIVTIGNAGEAVDTVEQRVEFIQGEDRRKKRLLEILNSAMYAPPIIVFVNIKRNCDMVARDLKHAGWTAVTLHGSKSQEQREAALQQLRQHQADVLVATDLAGRGIDVPDVSLVVNFNMATNIESYTHRIGRTGRAGKSGVAITFLGGEDNDVLYDLKQMLQKSSISKVPDELRRHEAAQQRSQRSMTMRAKPTKDKEGDVDMPLMRDATTGRAWGT